MLKKLVRKIYRKIERFINQSHSYDLPDVNAGWQKVGHTPVYGNQDAGTMFDPYVFELGDRFKMLVSERKSGNLILLDSLDGIYWNNKKTLLYGRKGMWDSVVNRGCLLLSKGTWHLWYTGQNNGTSAIGYATSSDGLNYLRQSESPVIESDNCSVMNPCVLYDEITKKYRMWYSSGEDYEPDVICYAESIDGTIWNKRLEPVLTVRQDKLWEKFKIGGCCVIQMGNGLIMYYIGYQNLDVARVCEAFSKDGISWMRNDQNWILAPSKKSWDSHAVYKPSAIVKPNVIYLWYNGRTASEEYIGMAKLQRL